MHPRRCARIFEKGSSKERERHATRTGHALTESEKHTQASQQFSIPGTQQHHIEPFKQLSVR